MKKHWNRGDDWTETVYFGEDTSSTPCNFEVKNQSSTPFEIPFSECDVKPSYPDPNDMEKLKFELNGIVREEYNVSNIPPPLVHPHFVVK